MNSSLLPFGLDMQFVQPYVSDKQAQQKTGIVFWLCEYQMGQDTFCARHQADTPAFCARDD